MISAIFSSETKIIRIIILTIFVGSLMSCAPIAVNLPPLNNSLAKEYQVRPAINKITIINKAKEGELRHNPFGTSYYPLIASESAWINVEKDIDTYLKARTDISEQSMISVRATIYKADIYREVGPAEQMPFISFLTLAADKTFGMNLKIIFEIEHDGKVEKTYVYDEIITEKGPPDFEILYHKIFSKYRKVFYGDLDVNFIPRYF